MTAREVMDARVSAATRRRSLAIHRQLESDCADAITLQDYDRLESIIVVYQDGSPPTVASTLTR